MTFLLYFTGLLIGIAVFLYILSTYEFGKEKITYIIRKGAPPEKNLEPDAIVMKQSKTRAPGTRICPLCGSVLNKYEALYASYIETKKGGKILIHGCRFCYKDDEDPDVEKRSAYK